MTFLSVPANILERVSCWLDTRKIIFVSDEKKMDRNILNKGEINRKIFTVVP